jgi:hypothetical protein
MPERTCPSDFDPSIPFQLTQIMKRFASQPLLLGTSHLGRRPTSERPAWSENDHLQKVCPIKKVLLIYLDIHIC